MAIVTFLEQDRANFLLEKIQRLRGRRGLQRSDSPGDAKKDEETGKNLHALWE